MCGIWGSVNIADRKMAEDAAKAMQHRGPDDYGIYLDDNPERASVALVNTRLSIIDLSQAGHQPISTADGRYWIVYNGEVYNFQPLREHLIEAGHRFRSNTDTEVILYAYVEWGESCLKHLRGMFAFAIWDTVEQKLFAARDRLGIKPLYHSVFQYGGRTCFLFGSELKALLASGYINPILSKQALHHYLSFYAVPAPYSILEGISALPPGHFLRFEDGRLHTEQYWEIPVPSAQAFTEQDAVAELYALLEESIRLRMIADVPVGAFLSGGLDSSAVVALMTRISGDRLRTFSVGFGDEGRRLDERADAQVIADMYGTDHREVILSGKDVRDRIDHIITSLDQPSGDGINTYFVSLAAGQHVKVALSGLGGDELFAGYPQFQLFAQADRLRSAWERLPGLAHGAVRSMGRSMPQVRRALQWVDGSILDRYQRVRFLFNEPDKYALYTPEFRQHLNGYEPSFAYLERFVHPDEHESLTKLSRLELKHYMAHTLLRDTDAMSMAHSLEVRVPLIDHRLVEFAAGLPPHLKLQGRRSKWIFTKALKGVLPSSVINRPKRGFEMPVAAWLQNDLRDVMDDVFSTASLRRRGVFDEKEARSIYHSFLAGKGPYLRPWTLAILELWCRRFCDKV